MRIASFIAGLGVGGSGRYALCTKIKAKRCEKSSAKKRKMDAATRKTV